MLKFIDPVQHAKERIERALAKQARLAGDAAEAKTMLDFYTRRAQTTDPHADWWTFADAKQKQVEYERDFNALLRKAEVAQARVEAETAKLEKIKCDTPKSK